MAKSEKTSLTKDFFAELIKDTDMMMASESTSMTSILRPKIRHPLWVLNCLCGGGIPMSLQTEFCGQPSSGKTTGAYTMLGNYLRDNPNGVGVIIDMEGSMDNSRLINLGVDVNRVIRQPAQSLENGFGNMFRIFTKLKEAKEKIPEISVMVVFDSISSGGTDKQHQTAEEGNSVYGSGPILETPRILKQNTANVFPFIEDLPILIVYINQVSTVGIGTYVPKIDSVGGWAFKHNMQFSLIYGAPKDVYEDGFIVGTRCDVDVKKSKLSPKFVEIPCIVSANGGTVDEVGSFLEYIAKAHVGIIKTGSYYSIKETIDLMIERYPVLKDNAKLMNYYKSIRRADLYKMVREDEDMQKFLQIRLIDFIDEKYPLQRDINNAYQQELIKTCSYFSK